MNTFYTADAQEHYKTHTFSTADAQEHVENAYILYRGCAGTRQKCIHTIQRMAQNTEKYVYFPEHRKTRVFYKTDRSEQRKTRVFYKTDRSEHRKTRVFYETDRPEHRKARVFYKTDRSEHRKTRAISKVLGQGVEEEAIFCRPGRQNL